MPKYHDQLLEFDRSPKRQLDLIPVQALRDGRTSLLMQTEQDGKLDELTRRIERILPKPETETSKASRLPVGLGVPLKELKKLLEDGVSRLVLTGPQGYGKTTLAKQFCQDEDVKDIFKNNIFFVLVSKKPTLEHIVQQLYRHKEYQVPNDLHLEEIAVLRLHSFLKEQGQNPVLLVLDDVWSESVLDKFDQFKMSNYKILVTSISEFPRFGYAYRLKPLNDEDAMTLFHRSASLRDESSYVPQPLARQIVERCKGFPLAITAIGRKLCGQSFETWTRRLRVWCEDSSLLDSETDFVGCFQRNLDALDKKRPSIRECFIDLGSFPENQRIHVADLIDIWTELYELDEDTLPIANLHELTSLSLANYIVTREEKMKVDGYYSEHFLTQHYMLRQLAIYRASRDAIVHRERLILDIRGNNLPSWLKEQKAQPVKARLLSISTDGMFSTKWPNMQLPEVEVLVLTFQTKSYALPEFVEKLEKLKALVVTYYGSYPAELRKFWLLGSLPNLKRIRLERISIPSIRKSPIVLKSLQKISFFRCNIGEDFVHCSIKLSDALPNLAEMNIDFCNDLMELPDKLCGLFNLKKLSITNCCRLSTLPVGIGQLANLEVLRLRSCTDLLKLPGSIRKLKRLNFLDISDCSSIMELPEYIGEMCSLRKLNIRHCSKLKELPQSVSKLEQLKDVICDEATEKLWQPFLPSFRNICIKVAM
ncbi:unnamed protein product [Prunus armeniaca]|uniref:Uncharacterized protein n=1 Tax=Prunus armeniaca TaxID=36596 RepID=A0A6J5XVC4_PRUAR|nr:unnamed protein product [Prunus armeniaca]